MKKRKKIAMQLVTRYTALFLAALAVVFILTTCAYYQAIFREKSNVLQQKLDICSEELDEALSRITRLHLNLTRNEYLQRELDLSSQGELPDETVSNTIGILLSGFREDSIAASAIYAYSLDGTLLASASNSLQQPPEELSDAVSRFLESRAYRKIYKLSGGDLVYFGAAPNHNYRYVGAYAIVINANRLFYNFQLETGKDFDAAYIYDGSDLVFETGGIHLDMPLDENAPPLIAGDGARYLQCRERCSFYAEWQLISVFNFNHILQETVTLILTLILALALVMVCIIYVSFGIAKRITAPVSAVIDSMKELEQGTFLPPLPSETQDEINDLVCGYNHMVKNLKKLQEDIAFEQQEKRRYETASIKMQLDLLQSQINPHFIHNTLNTLNYMALEAGNLELSSTILSFNSLLRASINTETEYTTVSEEVQYIKYYMNIQSKRYADREVQLTFTVDQAEDALLPRLILQPLVENSLFHGILPMEQGIGRIHILCSDKDGILHVYITDNGVGIPEETLDRLNRGEIAPSGRYSHIGLSNVKERLQLLYGDSVLFTIISQEHNGTTIYFSIPSSY